jgi:hypothetical protein
VRRLIVLAIPLTFLLPSVAEGQVYCLADPTCVSSGGTQVSSLQQAMDSSMDPDHDRIEIGDTRKLVPLPGGTYHSDNPLEIVGEGPGISTLGGSTTVLSLGSSPDVSVSNLTVVVQPGSGGIGIELAGARGHHVSVVMQADTSAAAISAIASTSNIDDALVELGTTAARALLVANGSGVDATLKASHLTIVGTGRAGQVGGAVAAASSGQTMMLNLRNSIIDGVEHSLRRSAPAGTAVINTDYSNYDAATQVDPPNSGGINALEQSHLEPGFVDRSDRNYRLSAGSPLIDAGDPAGLGTAEASSDLGGNKRLLNGNADCVPERDVGAYEFIAPTAFASISASASQAFLGEAVIFDGSGSCDPDPAATLAYGWSFDDGGAGSGPSMSHAFATAGSHSAQLTVTSSEGRVGSTSATIAVSAPPAIGSTTAPHPAPFSRTRLRPPVMITRRIVTISRAGIATIPLKCAGEVRCIGRVALRTLRPVTATKQIQKLGSARYSIPAGRITRVKVRIARAKLRVIKTRRRLAARVTVTDRDTAGRTRVVTRNVQLKTR